MTEMQEWRARRQGFWSCLRFFISYRRWPQRYYIGE